jgi:hypothetical protein
MVMATTSGTIGTEASIRDELPDEFGAGIKKLSLFAGSSPSKMESCDELPSNCASKSVWHAWLDAHTNTDRGEADFGLSRIAHHLGEAQTQGLFLYREGAVKEADEDMTGATLLYRKAFKLWPALDWVIVGGLPRGVRDEALAAGLTEGLLGLVDVSEARATRVHAVRSLLTQNDLADITALQQSIALSESTLNNNPQNTTHQLKVATFLNNPPDFPISSLLPHVVGKMVWMAMQAWETDRWSGTPEKPGPLSDIPGGLSSLSIRVVEHWRYDVGGGLVDDYHYDTDSVITIVALLSDANDFDGGVFRTFECDDAHLDHPMSQGDVICFLSHKYHNVVALTRGIRKSMVIELWQGGIGHEGR